MFVNLYCQVKLLVEKFGLMPNNSVGLFTTLEHAVAGRHFSTVKLLWELHKKYCGSDRGEWNRGVKMCWLLANPINLFDKMNGHLINCGNDYQEIKRFLIEKRQEKHFTFNDMMTVAVVTSVVAGSLGSIGTQYYNSFKS